MRRDKDRTERINELSLCQSRDRNFLSREESANFKTPTSEAIAEQISVQDNSREDGTGKELEGEEMQPDLNS